MMGSGTVRRRVSFQAMGCDLCDGDYAAPGGALLVQPRHALSARGRGCCEGCDGPSAAVYAVDDA